MEVVIFLFLGLGALVFVDGLRRFFVSNKDVVFNKAFRKNGSFFWFLGLRKVRELFAYLFLGLIALGYAAYGTVDHFSFYGNAISAMGEVEKIEAPIPGFAPVLIVKFTDRNGQSVSAKVSNTSSSDEFLLSQPLEIFYQPENENVAQLADRYWGFEIVLVFGIFLVVLGWLAVRSTAGSITD